MAGKRRKRPETSYASAGVDIDAAARAVELIKKHARPTLRPEVLADIGRFAALFQLQGYREPVLVVSADGVGTKLKIAVALNRHHTIGKDLVNHCVNDILTSGAEPLLFLDYIAVGKLVPEQVESIVQGVAEACGEVGCALIGGETAEMPDVYARGDYDLVGFIVGVVERQNVIDGSAIEAGDALIGLPSSGLHTNGYSLVRALFLTSRAHRPSLEAFYPELSRTLGEELLEPHRCYYQALKSLLGMVKGLAHITGGGLIDNIPRILAPALAARLKKGAWEVLPIFSLIQQRGNIDDDEMYRVFNMGLGMVVVSSPQDVERLLASLPGARVVGEVVEGRGGERVVIE